MPDPKEKKPARPKGPKHRWRIVDAEGNARMTQVPGDTEADAVKVYESRGGAMQEGFKVQKQS